MRLERQRANDRNRVRARPASLELADDLADRGFAAPLDGFGLVGEPTRQQLAVTKLNRDISDVQLRATITNTLSNVRNAYWDYVFAVQSVDVAQKSVDLAMKLVQDNQTRVEVGTMAPIDVVQAQSQAATARQNLAAALQTMRTSELVLKRLIVSGTEDPNWSVRLDPVDRPDFAPQAIDLEVAIRNALSQRTDVEIAKKSVQANDVTLRFLRDQLKPQADLSLSYVPQGLGGTNSLCAIPSNGRRRQRVSTRSGNDVCRRCGLDAWTSGRLDVWIYRCWLTTDAC